MSRAFRAWSLGRYGFVSPEVALALGSASNRLQADVYLIGQVKADAVELARKVQGLVAAPAVTDRHFRADKTPVARDLTFWANFRTACFVHEIPLRMGAPVLELTEDGNKQIGRLGLLPGLNGLRLVA